MTAPPMARVAQLSPSAKRSRAGRAVAEGRAAIDAGAAGVGGCRR
jgi:hypothetical protein